MFPKGKLARRVLVPVAAGAAILATVGVGSAFAMDDATAATTHQVVAASTGVVPATATTVHNSKPGTPPSGVIDAKWCSSYSYPSQSDAHACFQRSGDVIWIDNAVGDNVKAHWENWLEQADGTWVFYRDGDCLSTTYGWGYCNEDFYEDTSHNAVGGHGSGIRLYTCVGDCNPDYQWVRNNT